MTNKEAINLIVRNKSIFQYDEEMKKDLDIAIKALQDERPQGEWIIVKDEKWGDNVKCPFCNKELAGTDLNFCCKCGADMRKTESVKPDTFGCFNCKYNGKRVTESPCITCGAEYKNWVDYQEETHETN